MSQKFQQAYSFILRAIESGEFGHSHFFPSAVALSRMAGVSPSTVLKALRKLRKEGRLAGAHRRRSSLPHRPEDSSSPVMGASCQLPERKTKCLAVQRRILSDILNGRFRRDDPLPTEKELTTEYGASPMTLRKALRGLVEQAQLHKRGRKFFLEPVGGGAGSRPRIVLFGQGENMGANILWGDWHREYFKLLEQECVRSRLTLDVVCFLRDENGLRLINGRTWEPWTPKTTSDVEGYIYEVTGVNCFEDTLLQSLAVTGKPVALLDEVGEWPSPAFLKSHPNVRVFRNTISARPAQQVAHYVLESGHRDAVYISPYHHLAYSRQRYRWIEQTFSAIDCARITPITHEGEPVAGPESAGGESDSARLFGDYVGWVHRLPECYGEGLDRDFSKVFVELQAGNVRRILYRLCEQALTIKTATVWIAVNDFCAFWANAFLGRRNIHVPGSGISIISFDDDPAFLDKNMTTYNFNKAGMICAMLRYIRYPRLFSPTRPVIEIEGHIVPRATTSSRPQLQAIARSSASARDAGPQPRR